MDVTRRRLMAAGAGGAAALAAPSLARAAERLGDAGVLATILRVELLQAYVYEAGRRSGLLSEGLAARAAALRDHEQAHAGAVATNLEALGGAKPAAPQTDGQADAALAELQIEPALAAVRDEEDFLRLAIALEETAVALHHRAIGRLEDVRLIQTSASILAAAAQHLVLLREAAGTDPIPREVETGRA